MNLEDIEQRATEFHLKLAETYNDWIARVDPAKPDSESTAIAVFDGIGRLIASATFAVSGRITADELQKTFSIAESAAHKQAVILRAQQRKK